MYNKILVPLDGSKLSENSLTHVQELLTGCYVRDIILLMVIGPSDPIVLDGEDSGAVNKEFLDAEKEMKKAKEQAEKYLIKAGENLKKMGVMVQNVIIPLEHNLSVAEIILQYAEKNEMDLIVMSTHGRSGVTRWAFGSVADRVVRHSKIPVLTIAPAGARQ
jgi:nucleotide-binding universal stress UspA family protein